MYFVFRKPNIYLYAPWAKSPEPNLFEIQMPASQIEEAIALCEVETGLSIKKNQFVICCFPAYIDS